MNHTDTEEGQHLTPEQLRTACAIAEELVGRAREGELSVIISACIAVLAACAWNQGDGDRVRSGDLLEGLCREMFKALAVLYTPMEKPRERS